MHTTESHASFVTSFRELSRRIPLSDREIQWFREEAHTGLPFCISPIFMREIERHADDFSHPIRLQSIPTVEELHPLPYESPDPLCESRFSPFPGAVHRYPSRLLLYAGSRCAHYCRHCFRRHLPTGNGDPSVFPHLSQLNRYLEAHPEIDEVLLSGGDPLFTGEEKLAALLQCIDSAGGSRSLPRVIRLCSRIPVTLPSGITPSLLRLLTAHKPIWLITHINHVAELTPEALEALERLQNAGIPVLNQTVLLAGINDSESALKALWTALVAHSVKPYYLFQGDLASGTRHFRVPILKGMELMKSLRKQLSGLALPVYAVDLPGGGGKIPLTENFLQQADEKQLTFLSPEGERFYYPNEENNSGFF